MKKVFLSLLALSFSLVLTLSGTGCGGPTKAPPAKPDQKGTPDASADKDKADKDKTPAADKATADKGKDKNKP